MKNLIICTIIVLFSNDLIGQGFPDYLIENPEKSFSEIKAHLDAYYSLNDNGRGTGYKHYLRWSSDVKFDGNDKGMVQNSQARVFEQYAQFKKSNRAEIDNKSQHGKWKLEGPTDYVETNGWNGGVGRVNRLYFHPNQSNTFFACTPAGGLWRTQNDGSTWIPLTDGLPRIGSAGLAIHPNDNNIMYLLTGDNDSQQSYSIGVLKSIDGGLNWNRTGLLWNDTTTIRARKLLMHPNDPNILFVASNEAIHRSTNGALTWDTVQLGNFYDIEFQPNNPSTMYASVGGSFFKSTNSGVTWVENNDTDFPIPNPRVEIAVTEADSNYVYIIFGDHNGVGKYHGLYRSTDAGGDFALQSETPNILGASITGQDNKAQGTWDLALLIDPNDKDIVYVGGINIWKSTNSGSTWTIKSFWNKTNNSTGYTHADIHALYEHNGGIYVASDGGVYKSSDGGENWSDLSNGLGLMQPYAMDVADSVITCGTQDNGSNQWDVGTQVATHTLGGDGFGCLINFDNSDIRYQTTQTTLQKSTNAGVSFSNISVPGVTISNPYWEAPFIMNHINSNMLFIGLDKVYRSDNSGGTWVDMNEGITGALVTLDFGSGGAPRAYAASNQVMRRTDNAYSNSPTWTTVTPTVPAAISENISQLFVSGGSSREVFVCYGGFTAGHKVYHTTDGGTSWQNISENLPNVPIRSIMEDPSNQQGNGIYVGTDIGVFYKLPNSATWIYYSNGLPVVPVRNLDFYEGRLYAGTFGRGIWSTEEHGGCVSGIILTQADSGTGTQIQQSSDFISSSQIVSGGLGTDIQYRTGNEITLTTGFHVMKDNLFEATLGGCN